MFGSLKKRLFGRPIHAVSVWSCYSNSYISSFQDHEDGICVLRKACMQFTLSLRTFPTIAFETVPLFIWLVMSLSPFIQGRSSGAPSFHACLLQAIDGAISYSCISSVVFVVVKSRSFFSIRIQKQAFERPWILSARTCMRSCLISVTLRWPRVV